MENSLLLDALLMSQGRLLNDRNFAKNEPWANHKLS